MSDSHTLRLTIGGQVFGLKATKESEIDLKDVSTEVNARIQKLQTAGLGSTQRAATMAAFQLAYELKQVSAKVDSESIGLEEIRERVDNIISKLDEVIAEG